MNEIAGAMAKKTDVPADVKASFEGVNKELSAIAPRLAAPAGRGGGRGGAPDSITARVAQAKNALMATMGPTEQTTRAYTEAKAQTPKAIADLNAVIAKAAALAPTLAKYDHRSDQDCSR